jgi:uncharacterized protein YnzC (UPF0291/DUF896 family)
MRLNIDTVWGHQIDDVLIRFAFTAWIAHTLIIAKNGDDVNPSKVSS